MENTIHHHNLGDSVLGIIRSSTITTERAKIVFAAFCDKTVHPPSTVGCREWFGMCSVLSRALVRPCVRVSKLKIPGLPNDTTKRKTTGQRRSSGPGHWWKHDCVRIVKTTSFRMARRGFVCWFRRCWIMCMSYQSRAAVGSGSRDVLHPRAAVEQTCES